MTEVLDESFQIRVLLDCLLELTLPHDFQVIPLGDVIGFSGLSVGVDLVVGYIPVGVNGVWIGAFRTAMEKTPVELVDGVVCLTKAIDEEVAHLMFTMTVAHVLYILMRFLGLPLHPADSHFRLKSIPGLTRNETNLLVLQ